MKLQLAILLSLTFLSSQLLAQTISTQLETETATVTASQGVRLSLMKPFLETRLDTEFPGLEGGTTKSRENETSFGLGVGYADLPIRDIGFTTNASYLFLDQDQADSILRLDGNLGYAFNSKLNLKGGVNVSKYFDGEIGKKLAPGAGVQASIGYQMMKQLGVEAGYSVMTHGGNNKGGRTTSRINGFEVGVTGTF